jgi:hypothetical protein
MTNQTDKSQRKSGTVASDSPQQASGKIESLSSLHDKIRERAFQIWLEKGCPFGRDIENWQQAERELTQSIEPSITK